MSKIEINKEMVVSTYHFSEGCLDQIEKYAGGNTKDDHVMNMLSIIVEPCDYGFRIFTTFDTEENVPDTTWEGLNIILKHAKSLECKWLVIDSDCPINEEFETFGD